MSNENNHERGTYQTLRFRFRGVRITNETTIIEEGINDVLGPPQTLVVAALDRREELCNAVWFLAFHVDRRGVPTPCDFASMALGPLDLREGCPLSCNPELKHKLHLEYVNSDDITQHQSTLTAVHVRERAALGGASESRMLFSVQI